MSTNFTNNHTEAAEALRDFYIRAQRTLDKRLTEQGATIARIKIMGFIQCGGRVRSTDLAAAFGFAPRTITEAVDGLEREGLVERVVDESDRRVKFISLTALGQQVLKLSEPVRKRFVGQLFDVLSAEELANLTQLLERLNENLRNLEDEA